PVSKFARSTRPGAEPASTMYELAGSPPGADQNRETVEPLTEDVRLSGDVGTVRGMPVRTERLCVVPDGHVPPALEKIPYTDRFTVVTRQLHGSVWPVVA